jgi:Uma2 family endonuclease
MRLLPGLIRIPDVAFVRWARFPEGRLPREPIPSVAPDLAIEVLSESNTAAEMLRKVTDYFQAGTLLVWIIDPLQRTATIFQSPQESTVLHEHEVLDGGQVLPGFRVRLVDVFSQLGDRNA